MTEVDSKTSALFGRLTERDLDRKFKLTRPDGTETMERVEDILYHVPIEVIHHYGEIFGVFWEIGLIAPYYPIFSFLKNRGEDVRLT